MGYTARTYQAAVRDFPAARQRAALQEIMARLTGQSVGLLSYEEVARKLKTSGSVHRGRQDVPLDGIVGSVGRYTDFTRSFLPRHDSDQDRWARGRGLAAVDGSAGVPPLEGYKIGEAYFVLDG